jgi:hypothetical protein
MNPGAQHRVDGIHHLTIIIAGTLRGRPPFGFGAAPGIKPFIFSPIASGRRKASGISGCLHIVNTSSAIFISYMGAQKRFSDRL